MSRPATAESVTLKAIVPVLPVTPSATASGSAMLIVGVAVFSACAILIRDYRVLDEVKYILGLAAIFLPAFLLVIGVLPFWDDLRRFSAVRAALTGVNAAVVGLLLAALYDPVWTSGILGAADFALALAAFALLVFWKTPPWLVVLLSALAGWGVQAWMG